MWREASRLGLTGWVRNRRDGTVEVLAIGSPDTLDELEERLAEGPRWSQVDRVEATDEAAVPAISGFAVRHDA